MNELSINISWEYFLGIVAFLIGIAWYSGSRFSAIETSIQWLKENVQRLTETVSELKNSADNTRAKPVFETSSPINLTKIGEVWLVESGLKRYIDSRKDNLLKDCEEKKETNPYEIQKHIFKLFDTLPFDPDFDGKLKKFAYDEGTTLNLLRRIGAIYFRNICLESFGMNKEDIDKHDPDKTEKDGK